MSVKPVSLKRPYVYLNSLQDTHPDIWNKAEALVNNISLSNTATAEERLSKAISFLKIIHAKQLAGQQRFIEDKLKQLEQIKKTKINDTHLLNKITRINQFLNDWKNKSKEIDYFTFTKLLNEIINTNQEYLKIAERLTANYNNGQSEELLSYLSRIDDQLMDVFEFVQNQQSTTRSQTINYDKLIPAALSDMLREEASHFTPTQAAAYIIKTVLNFRKWLSQRVKKDQKVKFTKRTFRNGETLEQRLNTIRKDYQQFLQENKKFKNTTVNQLNNFAELIGLKTKSNFEGELPKASMLFNLNTDLTQSEIQPVVIVKSNLKSSRLAEILTQFFSDLKGFETGKINMGDDALYYYGTINADVKTEQEKKDKQLEKTTLEIIDLMKKFAKVRNNRTKVTKATKEMNDKIIQRMKRLDTLLLIKQLGHGFIIHESTKFYETIEAGHTGNWNNTQKAFNHGFSGRSLAILNYIDLMNDLSQRAGGTFLNLSKNQLYFLALNLGTASPAHDIINDLEIIFTEVASLIMFDDASVMITEVMEGQQLSNITNLHIYNLQGIYVPASYIIQETINYLSNLNSENIATNAATVKITTIDDPAKYYDNKNKEKNKKMSQLSADQQWEATKSLVATNTKASIHFFYNFQQFVSQLLPSRL